MSEKIFVVSDFNADPVGRYLDADAGEPACKAHVAPFGQVFQSLNDVPADCAGGIAFLWTRPEGVSTAFADAAEGNAVSMDRLMADVDFYADAITRLAGQMKLVLVASWTGSHNGRGLGMLEWSPQGQAHQLAAMNLRLAEKLAKTKGAFVLDANRWLTMTGEGARPPKHWLTMKSPFSEKVCQLAAEDVKAAIRASLGQTRKLVVLDLDNTLWGGIVGDDGWENLRLGGHDHIGEAHVELQRALKALSRRGIQLALVSKNEEATALDAFDRHPEMVLKHSDLAGWRINWNDKAQNIVELVKDLNLGLQSVVFLDDNPTERGRVREALPQVLVPELPESPVNYASILRSLSCFDQAAITDEDRDRTTMYAAERERKSAASEFSSPEDWLAALDVKVDIAPLEAATTKRAVQLINKTNQMTLTARRLTETELAAWLAADSSRALYTVSVGDRFGNLGLTGAFTWQRNGLDLEVVDWVLSCRAMGRKVEETITHFVLNSAKKAGATRVTAHALETGKNMPCLSFWRKESGFVEPEPLHFVSAATPAPLVRGITLTFKEAENVRHAAPR